MQRLLCEDVVVALYICVLLFKFIWLIMGSVWSADATLLPCPNGFSTMIDCMSIFGYVFFGVGAALILWHWIRYSPCCLACFPEESQEQQQARQLRLQNKRLARRNRRNGNNQRQPAVQNMNRQQAPGPAYQQAPVYHSNQMPVATAQPVQGTVVHNNQQFGAVQQIPNNNQPQVVVHQPARTANNTGAAKKEESTASKLFGKAKGLFGR